MPEPATLFLLAATACAFAGMGWLALSMPVHALQAWGALPPPGQLKRLRWIGGAAVLLALPCAVGSDHASMAVLVWVMLLAAGAFATTMALARWPRRLRLLAPWVREANNRSRR